MYCTYTSSPWCFGASSPQTTRIIHTQEPLVAGSRIVVIPAAPTSSSERLRRLYASLDADDDDVDSEYVVPPSFSRPLRLKVSNYLDRIFDSPHLEIEAETKKIRRDAQAALQRLGEPRTNRPRRVTSSFFPDLSYTINGNSAYAEDINSYVDNEHRPRSTAYNSRFLLDPVANKVQSEINRKAIYSPNCRKINDSVRGAVRRRATVSEADAVKNNINFRAQYASMRAAATVGVRKPNDYLMV